MAQIFKGGRPITTTQEGGETALGGGRGRAYTDLEEGRWGGEGD